MNKPTNRKNNMKAILFSIGERGDIEPFLAIAQLLKEKDWDLICVFPEQFRETVEKMNIPFRGFNKEFLDMLDSKEVKMVMGGQGSIFKRVRMMIKIARIGIKFSKDMLVLQHKIQKKNYLIEFYITQNVIIVLFGEWLILINLY